jgi:hypothetical protein
MNSLCFFIIAFLLVMLFFSFNTAFAQSETPPTIYFDHASYGTPKTSCDYYATGKISAQDKEQSKATVIVTDPSANKFSASIDRVTVYIWSDSDRKDIEITAYETDVNSGIFKGAVTVSDDQSSQDIIHVSDGDTLWAKYSGTTPWSPDTANHGITTTAFIGALCPPLERVPASGIQVTDNEGNKQKTVLAGKQIQIGSNLTNVTNRNQTFAYIVQISDTNQIIESLPWVSGTLFPSQTFSPSVSWTPPKAGNYTVNVFVWQSISNPNALSPPVYTNLTVWPSLSAYANSTIRNENPRCQSGYEFVIKSSDNSLVCVSHDTAQKLQDRGWTKRPTGVPGLANPPVGLYNLTLSTNPIILGIPFYINAVVVNHETEPITYYGGCVSPLSVSFDKIKTSTGSVHCLAISKYTLEPNQSVPVQTDKIETVYNATGPNATTNAKIRFSYETDGKQASEFTSMQIPVQAAIMIDCSTLVNLHMVQIDKSVNVTKAITLAYNSPEFLAKVMQYGDLSYFGFYNDWFSSASCHTYWNGTEVMFASSAKSGTRNIQVSEDINLTKVLRIRDFQVFAN